MSNRTKFKDDRGRFITQGLFLELGYNTDLAVFTLDDDDKLYNGETYRSLKKLYLELSDVTEYDFACTNLAGWKHWKRIQANKLIAPHVEEWREELELSLRAEGLRTIISAASSGDSFAAGKWLVDKGWSKRPAGRPSKAQVKESMAKDKKLADEFQEDFQILKLHEGK